MKKMTTLETIYRTLNTFNNLTASDFTEYKSGACFGSVTCTRFAAEGLSNVAGFSVNKMFKGIYTVVYYPENIR